MTTLRTAAILALLALAAKPAQAGDIPHSPFSNAAIAYSDSTKRYAWSFGYFPQANADKAALKLLGEKDGRIIGWAQGGWLCFVRTADGSWGVANDVGPGSSNKGAYDDAVKVLRTVSRDEVVEYVIVCTSGAVKAKHWKKK